MTDRDETNDASTHVADLGKFSRCVFIYWATTLVAATLITGTFVTLMGFVQRAVH